MKVFGWLVFWGLLISASCIAAEKPAKVTWDGKEIEGITDVHIGSGGKIIVIYSGGGFSTTEDKLPVEFLRGWGISAESITSAQESRLKAAADNFERAVRSGLFREVGGIVYDLRKSQPDWIVFGKVKVIQITERGIIGDATPDERHMTPIFVRNLPPTIGDTDVISFNAKLSGSYSYINKLGDDRTIRAYDVGRPCGRDEIPDAITKDNKLWGKVVGEKADREVMARLPDSEEILSSGTGFFISQDGYLLTNFHVVEGAKKIKIKTKAGVIEAEVIKSDRAKDLALLKTEGRFTALSVAEDTAALGESVFTIGFPNIEVQGLEPKYTDGKISSLSGMHDDPDQFQVSVPVQPGNSGGPLMSRSGKVVGIVEAKLNALKMMVSSGDVPQNVNYAIKAKVIRGFLAEIPAFRPAVPTSKLNEDQVVETTTEAVAIVLIY